MKGRARVHKGRSMRLSLQDKKAVCGSLRRAWRQTRVARCSPKSTPMPLLWPMDRRGGSGSQSERKVSGRLSQKQTAAGRPLTADADLSLFSSPADGISHQQSLSHNHRIVINLHTKLPILPTYTTRLPCPAPACMCPPNLPYLCQLHHTIPAFPPDRRHGPSHTLKPLQRLYNLTCQTAAVQHLESFYPAQRLSVPRPNWTLPRDSV
jgi:hypothetical protein